MTSLTILWRSETSKASIDINESGVTMGHDTMPDAFVEITADRVLRELARIGFLDLRKLYREDGCLVPPHEGDDDTAAAVAGVEVLEEFAGRGEDRSLIGYTKKVKLVSKEGTLTLAARHLGMLHDNVKIEDNGLVDKLTKGVARSNKVKK